MHPTYSPMNGQLHWLLKQVERAARIHRLVIWLANAGIFAFSGVAAFLLRFDLIRLPSDQIGHLVYGVSIWVVVKTVVFRLCCLDRGWWRFVSIRDLFRIAAGNALASAGSTVVILLVAPSGFPRSIYVLDFLICFLATAGIRVLTRILVESAALNGRNGFGKRVLIYGAGTAGLMLLRELRSNPAIEYNVCGFVDDHPRKKGVLIQGVTVLGSGAELKVVVEKHRIDEVLIAAPSASGQEMTRIMSCCFDAGIRCRTVPALAEIIEGNALTHQIRDVAVEDLLGRNPVRLEADQISSKLEGKMVLVTGAAGSIGSELCRQIARFGPAAIVGFEIGESPLFELDREMRRAYPATPFYPEIGSIQNRERLDEVLGQYSPSVVYHAAAYKHVPMMEAHVFEAIENNVFGTYNVAVAAAERGVEDFVLISSDKAVRPSNVMGATKRLAELVVLAVQEKRAGLKPNGRLKPCPTFVAVRFGNVLGSNGSVIPIFKQQIAAGGPVTVTHPEMRRYFMTIPEACQLVLQASAMGQAGQICVLDMGEPVKIVDLAKNLILLSGLRPDEDIKIEFTGVRPGEKLYEELSTLLEDTAPTAHEKIRVYAGNGLAERDLLAWLKSLRSICDRRDLGELVVEMKELVPDYSPSAHLLRRLVDLGAKHAGAGVSRQ